MSLAKPIKHRKPDPEKLKRKAVALLRASGRPLAEVVRKLGVSTESLQLWRKQAEIDADEREGPSSEEHEEPRRPRHENHKVKLTRIWISLVVGVVAVAAVVVFLVAPLAGGGDDGPDAAKGQQAAKTEEAIGGSFVGKVSGTKAFLAVVAAPAAGKKDTRVVQVYVSDGRRLSASFSGPISDNSFVARSDDDREAKGRLSGDSVTGTVELPGGRTVAYVARLPDGAAGLYELTVSSDGTVSGASAAGLGVKGEVTLKKRGTGVLRLVDGKRLQFAVTPRPAGNLVHLKAGQIRLIVLPGGQIRGSAKGRRGAPGASEFSIRSV